jgi:hypothetical protein
MAAVMGSDLLKPDSIRPAVLSMSARASKLMLVTADPTALFFSKRTDSAAIEGKPDEQAAGWRRRGSSG